VLTVTSNGVEKYLQPVVSSAPVTPTSVPEELHALTGIRFFAAAWVVMFHFRHEFTTLIPAYRHVLPFADQGHYAVPFFFILSGFILSHTYFHRYAQMSHRRFVYLRFARLWPVHACGLLVLILYVGALAWRGSDLSESAYPIDAVPAELAMVRYWFNKELVWNYPAWSIQSEWFAYLFAFPVAYLLFHRVRRLAVFVPAVLSLLALHWFFPFPFPGSEILLLFLAGSALYRIRAVRPESSGNTLTVLGLLVGGFALSTEWSASLLLLYFAFAALILGLSYPRGAIGQLLGSRPVVYGGTISYCIYMTHALVGKFYGVVSHHISFSGYFSSLLVFAALVSAIVLTAAIFHHFVEVPCNRALRAKMRPQPR
jgi:peptidoglycan/LPS O-acetylase OafA/YrhL